jgi:hypothetical protein
LALCRGFLMTNFAWNRAGPHLGSFDIPVIPVRRFNFRLRCAFLAAVTQGYPDFSGLYCSMMQILVLLSYISVLVWELCFILVSSSQDIGAIWWVSDFFGAHCLVTLRDCIHYCRSVPEMRWSSFQSQGLVDKRVLYRVVLFDLQLWARSNLHQLWLHPIVSSSSIISSIFVEPSAWLIVYVEFLSKCSDSDRKYFGMS